MNISYIVHSESSADPLTQTQHSMGMETPPLSTVDTSICSLGRMSISPTRRAAHDGERPFQCQAPGCYQRFKRKFTLAEHTKTHTGERPFVCPVATCGKAFTTTGNLSRHKTLHPWLKSLTCLVEGCGRSFSNDVSLERHLITHFRGSRPSLTCAVGGCGKTFSTMGSLTRHVKQQHRHGPKRSSSPAVDESEGFLGALFEPQANSAGRGFSPLTGKESIVSDDELREFLRGIFDEELDEIVQEQIV